jgi:hypothetical protein
MQKTWRMWHLKALLACIAVFPTAMEAEAGCVSSRWRSSFEQNSTVQVVQTVTDRGCRFSFGGGLSTTYESITVVERPRHMTVDPLSNGFGLRLLVQGGYKGPDRYAVRVCGTSRTGKGCTTVAYNVTIK